MLTTGGRRPTQLNEFTNDVYDVLESFVVSPWSVLKVECGWNGVDPCSLDVPQLQRLLPRLVRHVARITDDDNADALSSALLALVTTAPAPSSSPVCFDY